jgi:hypothetical protein
MNHIAELQTLWFRVRNDVGLNFFVESSCQGFFSACFVVQVVDLLEVDRIRGEHITRSLVD